MGASRILSIDRRFDFTRTTKSGSIGASLPIAFAGKELRVSVDYIDT